MQTLFSRWILPWIVIAVLAVSVSASSFIQVSDTDSSYFEYADGRPYIPVGFNLVGAPEPDEFARILDTMAENGINLCRLWLDLPPWNVEHAESGVYDEDRLQYLDRFLALAAERGIYVKLCIEHFRYIAPERTTWADKSMHHMTNGGRFASTADFLESEHGQNQYISKMKWYGTRYKNNPIIFGWELWNEMDCLSGDWLSWTKQMLHEAHSIFTNQLCMQTLSSYSHAYKYNLYANVVRLPDNDVAQVHQYLDASAELAFCHGPIDVLAAGTVRQILYMNLNKPILVAEMGAVEGSHEGGMSTLYGKDKDGTLLHDIIFAPFFAGAAGSGHPWFWRETVDEPNQWHQFKRFATVVEGLDPVKEHFVPLVIAHPKLRIYALRGNDTFIAWCRDKANDWQRALVDGCEPEILSDITINVSAYMDENQKQVAVYNPWEDQWLECPNEKGDITLPPFQRSCVFKIIN